MKFKETYKYPAGVEAVFALVSDADFRTKAAEVHGALDVEASAKAAGGGITLSMKRTQPAKVPEFVKKIIGDSATVTQTEKWSAPDAQGTRTADVQMKVVGQPAGFKGKATLKNEGKGSVFTISGDVKVNVPFVGKKFEPVIAKAVEASIRHDVQAGVKKLS